jgi:hypothetical protein
MAVLILSADERFVHFNDATKFGFELHECRADFVAHAMRCLIATEADPG